MSRAYTASKVTASMQATRIGFSSTARPSWVCFKSCHVCLILFVFICNKTTTMIIVKVTYTVKQEFVQKNQENIKLFMNDFKNLNSTEFRYNAYLCNDG